MRRDLDPGIGILLIYFFFIPTCCTEDEAGAVQLLVLFPGWMSIISVGKMKELELEIIFLLIFPCHVVEMQVWGRRRCWIGVSWH